MKVEIFDISEAGEGIGRLDGKIVFVPFALPGEAPEIEITEEKPRFSRAKRLDTDGIKLCGGCPLIRMEYRRQLEWKEKRVRDCLERIARLKEPDIKPIEAMGYSFAYRNKFEFQIGAELPFCNINCTDCPIQNERTAAIVSELKEELTGGEGRLLVRTAQSGEYMACELQDGKARLLRGEKLIRDHIDSDMGRLEIEVDPFSFYQINPVQTSRLYSIAQSYAAPCGSDTLLDIYCGCGSIGLLMAKRAGRVIGIESLRSAVRLADRNARINGIENASFICGRAENEIERLRGLDADVMILDPPRAGCRESLLAAAEEIAPKRIVYISCNPASFARDIGRLKSYRLAELTPVDMFPHTASIELAALLLRDAR